MTIRRLATAAIVLLGVVFPAAAVQPGGPNRGVLPKVPQPNRPYAPPPKPPALNVDPPRPSAVNPEVPDEEVPGALPRSPFSELSALEAVKKSVAEHKLLIVIDSSRNFKPPQGHRSWYENIAVRSWIHWHAILIRVDHETAELMATTCRGGSRHPPFKNEYGMGIVINGKLECHYPFLSEDLTSKTLLPGRESMGYPTGLGALFAMNFAIECALARDSVYAALHERDNPPPPPPDMPSPLYSRNDGLAAPVADLAPVADGSRPDVLSRLAEARRLIEVRDRYAAAGLATWLWERGDVADRDFESARLIIMPTLMRDMAFDSGPQMRFKILRERAVARLPWADFHDYYPFVMACRASGETVREIAVFDELVNDADNAAMMPVADRIAYRTVFAAVALLDKPIEKSLEWIARTRRDLNAGRPRNVHDEDWPKLQTSLRWLLTHESARAFAELLKAGRDQEAVALLADARASSKDADVTRRFIMAAAAVEAPRPWMDALLDRSDPLRNHINK